MNTDQEILDIKKRIKTLESWQTDISRRLERYEDLVGRMELRLDKAGQKVQEFLDKAENVPESVSNELSGQDDNPVDPQKEP